MDVHLIDGAAAEGQGREKMIDRLLVTAEEETGKGLRMLLHLTNGGIHTLIGKDWEERSKDFVFHDRIVPGNGVNDGGIDVACLRVGRAASDDFALVDKACETFNRLWTYDARVVVGSVPRIIPVQLDDGFFAPLNEFLGNGFMHISVSGCSAPLAAPSRRTPDNFLGCVGDVCGRINECGILSAEFEEDGCQILCSRLHDDLTHLDTTGEEDEVERQL